MGLVVRVAWFVGWLSVEEQGKKREGSQQKLFAVLVFGLVFVFAIFIADPSAMYVYSFVPSRVLE